MSINDCHLAVCTEDVPGGSDGKASVYNARDPGSSPGSRRSSGEGKGNPLQDSSLKNPMDGGACLAIVQSVSQSLTQLSTRATKLYTSEKPALQ